MFNTKMKKETYITPAILVLKLNVEKMISVSGPEVLSNSADEKWGMDTKEEEDWDLWEDE